MFVLGLDMDIGDIVVLTLFRRGLSNLRRRSQARYVIINFIDDERRYENYFIRLARLYMTISYDARGYQDGRLVFSIGTVRRFGDFFVFTGLYMTGAYVDFNRIDNFDSTRVIYCFRRASGASTIAIRYLFMDVLFGMFLSFRGDHLHFFFAEFDVRILMRSGAYCGSGRDGGATSSYIFMLSGGYFQLYRYVFCIRVFILVLLFYRFCVVLFIVVHCLVFQLTGMIFLCLRAGFENVFFYFAPRGRRGLTAFIGGLEYAR